MSLFHNRIYSYLRRKMAQNSNAIQKRPTKRAPDAGDSAAISSSFLRLILFLVGRLRRPRPSAGNAIRWATLTIYLLKNAFSQ